jgi:hypothetical protein
VDITGLSEVTPRIAPLACQAAPADRPGSLSFGQGRRDPSLTRAQPREVLVAGPPRPAVTRPDIARAIRSRSPRGPRCGCAVGGDLELDDRARRSAIASSARSNIACASSAMRRSRDPRVTSSLRARVGAVLRDRVAHGPRGA